MKTNLIVIDDFYNNPDEVRKFALSQTFDVKGNFPGIRTKSFLTQEIKNTITATIFPFAGRITQWFDSGVQAYTGAFQLCTATDRTWIHSDPFNSWAGVCYLTPDAPVTAGTAFFRHKETKECEKVLQDHESYDYTKWEIVDRIGNKYNRLILFRSRQFHASVDYFGSCPHDGRLFQTFFFNTEK